MRADLWASLPAAPASLRARSFARAMRSTQIRRRGEARGVGRGATVLLLTSVLARGSLGLGDQGRAALPPQLLAEPALR